MLPHAERPDRRLGALVATLDEVLREADADLARRYPGERAERQPVHTVYVPADRAEVETAADWGRQALDLLEATVPGPGAGPVLADVTGLDPALVEQAYPRVRAKLEREPVEDLRIDLEDGYGVRADAEEDAHARAAVAVLRGTSAPLRGVRIKGLEAATRGRAVRSLLVVLEGLADTGGVPPALRLTLPKVTSVEQVAAMALLCARLEATLGLPDRVLGFEIQVETPQAVLAADGTATVARAVHAADGRCTGLHYGTYDYSAALGIGAAQQSLEHPAADHAKAVMQLAAAQTGVWVSDGSTNVVAAGTPEQTRATWALHARLVTRALERGCYQGWDLAPVHLPTRYLATYVHFRAALPTAARRLRDYLDRAGGDVLDEPATARALAGAVLRGLRCGAVDDAEVRSLAGLDRVEVEAVARTGGPRPGA